MRYYVERYGGWWIAFWAVVGGVDIVLTLVGRYLT